MQHELTLHVPLSNADRSRFSAAINNVCLSQWHIPASRLSYYLSYRYSVQHFRIVPNGSRSMLDPQCHGRIHAVKRAIWIPWVAVLRPTSVLIDATKSKRPSRFQSADHAMGTQCFIITYTRLYFQNDKKRSIRHRNHHTETRKLWNQDKSYPIYETIARSLIYISCGGVFHSTVFWILY